MYSSNRTEKESERTQSGMDSSRIQTNRHHLQMLSHQLGRVKACVRNMREYKGSATMEMSIDAKRLEISQWTFSNIRADEDG